MEEGKVTIKLKYKLAFFITFGILLIMSITTFISIKDQTAMLELEMKDRAIKISRSAGAMAFIKTSSEQENIQWSFAQQFIDLVYQLRNSSDIQLDKNILYVTVVEKDGSVPINEVNMTLISKLLKNPPADVANKLKEEIKNRVLNKTEIVKLPVLSSMGSVLPISIKLEPEGQYIGTMDICFSKKEIEETINKKFNESIYTTIFFIVVGFIIASIISYMITKPVNVLAEGMQKVRDGDFTFEVNIKSSDEFGMLAHTFNFMTKGLQEREKFRGERDKIRSTFSKYVSPQVVNKILEENIPTEGEKKKVTVLFSDIRGFTSMSEKMQPQEVIAMLNEYFSVMVDIIFKYEGTLDKYIGDAMMAEFGAPISNPDDSIRAVLTAFEMQATLKKLNESLIQLGKNPIHMGIGINTGEVVAGNIGSEKRMEYTVIGDNVNLTSRLCGACKGEQILISETTFNEVEQYIEANKLPSIMVKGKTNPIVIYEVIGVKKEASLKIKL